MGGDEPPLKDGIFCPAKLGREGLSRQPAGIPALLRLAMNINGVDFTGWPGGLVSAVHSDVDIEETKSILNWTPPFSFDEGIKITTEAFSKKK